MPSRYFFGFILSFITGVSLEYIFQFGYPFAALFLILAGAIVLLCDVRNNSSHRFLVSLVLVGCALGILRTDVSLRAQNVHTLDSFIDGSVRVEGIVVAEPDVREGYTNIVLETHDVFYKGKHNVLERPVKILARVSSYPALWYGDEVIFSGTISLPKNISPREGERPFDYRAYLANKNIFYQMFFPKVSLIAHGQGNVVYEKLFAFKKLLLKNIMRMIPEPEASLAGGVLLGAKQSLGEELLQHFRETGVAHIVVLSGYNIAVVASGVARVSTFLPFFARTGASVVAVVLFAMMVGGGATVARATIMILVVILARATGREGSALRALALAGGLMVVGNPSIIFYDVSFQLSFMATLALVVLAPVIEKYFLFLRWDTMREIVVTTLATQIFVLPLILYQMGDISLVGFVANIFILPVIPLAMFFVVLVAALSWLPLLGSVLSFVAYAILAYVIFAVSFFSRVPLASLSGISFSLSSLIVSYALLGIFIMRKSSYKKMIVFREKREDGGGDKK